MPSWEQFVYWAFLALMGLMVDTIRRTVSKGFDDQKKELVGLRQEVSALGKELREERESRISLAGELKGHIRLCELRHKNDMAPSRRWSDRIDTQEAYD